MHSFSLSSLNIESRDIFKFVTRQREFIPFKLRDLYYLVVLRLIITIELF
jgi:hypothetical protein